MIKKMVFGFTWFVIIFLVVYTAGGVIYVYVSGIDTSSGIKTAVEAGDAFRAAYIGYFLIGSLVLALLGTVKGILPGTKTKLPLKKETPQNK